MLSSRYHPFCNHFFAAENYNFVLGEASSKHRSGIFCFGRFPPSTFDADNPQDLTEITGDVIWKLMKVGTAETVCFTICSVGRLYIVMKVKAWRNFVPVSVTICVCVWERERVCVWERERECVCVCVRERERERECVVVAAFFLLLELWIVHRFPESMNET